MSSISTSSDAGFRSLREGMVDSQIRTNKVTSEPVIDALELVAREKFVPAELQGIAYVDDDIPLANGRCVMEPRALARMIQALDADSSCHALVVGAGSGYATAVLSRIVKTVVAEESVAEHAEVAGAIFEAEGYNNIVLEAGDLLKAGADHGPFDVVLFGGAIAQVPENLGDFLENGGRAIAVVTEAGEGFGQATLFTKYGSHIGAQGVFDAAIPSLPEFNKVQSFKF